MSDLTYNEALCTFRDLLDISVDEAPDEYVRGGINLIAELFGVVGQPVDERMDDVLADLRKIPMFAERGDLERYGVAPYDHDPVNAYEFPAWLLVREVKSLDEAKAKLDELITLVVKGDLQIGVTIDTTEDVQPQRLNAYGASRAT